VDPLGEEQSITTDKELLRQRLQGGSDAKGAVIVRPTWSRFSPGKLTKEKSIEKKSDAFNNVSDALGRCRHWRASEARFSPSLRSQPRADDSRHRRAGEHKPSGFLHDVAAEG
jgi:hypothetical protein